MQHEPKLQNKTYIFCYNSSVLVHALLMIVNVGVHMKMIESKDVKGVQSHASPGLKKKPLHP